MIFIQAGGRFIVAELLLLIAEKPVQASYDRTQNCNSKFFVTAIFSEQEGRLDIRSSSIDSRMSYQLVYSHLGYCIPSSD